jgi:hypothetical protein
MQTGFIQNSFCRLLTNALLFIIIIVVAVCIASRLQLKFERYVVIMYSALKTSLISRAYYDPLEYRSVHTVHKFLASA